MRSTAWLAALIVLWLPASPAGAACHKAPNLARLNQRLHGTVLDFSHNHGADRRIWSPALQQWRDLYVYVPPGYDESRQYPIVLWLHGFMQDEESFLEYVAELFDRAIVRGQLPPVIVAAPDGSIEGRPTLRDAGSFFINSNAGNFEDYVIADVWGFVTQNFRVRPEREAHVIAGLSMGGFGAYNLGIKHQDMFKFVLGIYPPLNLRWVDCHCRYMGNFDPCCWGWRTSVDRGREVIGRFYGGLIKIRLKRVVDPLFGRGPQAIASISRENPIEMIDAYGLRNGVLDMYVAYGGRDEFNIDAQVESFVYRARCQRGLSVSVGYDPEGRHNAATAIRLAPGAFAWLGPRLAAYAQPALP